MDAVFEGSGLGSLRAVYESLDWAATPLGPPTTWSPALRSTVALTMNTRFAVTLFWGPEFVLVYNEPYSLMIGDKHPAALGRPAQLVFPEIWDVIGPMMIGVRDRREAIWVRDEQLFIDRHGFAEETFFTFSYSPMFGVAGSVEGVVDIATETTREVVDRRRMSLLAELSDALSRPEDEAHVAAAAVDVLSRARDDLIAIAVHPAIAVADGWAGAESEPLPAAPQSQSWSGELLIETAPRRLAWLGLDGPSTPSHDAVLVAELNPHQPVDEPLEDFLRLVASAIVQAFDRVATRQAERRAADLERQMSETLQRSLLGEIVEPDGLRIAARYHAASEQAHVGGDWYDTFLLPDGALVLTVGDVSGHDRQAAARMGQARNLLRGIAVASNSGAAATLRQLDLALSGLASSFQATAIQARLYAADASKGSRRIEWSNAGHLPPILLHADGRPDLLETRPDLMLGVQPETARHDHAAVLERGATLVLYTDGLVERRGTGIDEQLALLAAELRNGETMDPDDLCDRLLERFAKDADDDIVLLVLRT